MYSLKRMAKKLLAGFNDKALILAVAVTMIVASVTGGTLAWIQAGTKSASNTFTVGNISIDLLETDTGLDADENPDTNAYQMSVGGTIAKDPTVIVDAYSMDCWLFVKVSESENFADFMDYAIADGWTPVEGETGLFVRPVDMAGEDQSFPVIMDNLVNVKDTVSLAELAALTPETCPTLSFTAYAVQRSGLDTPGEAWLMVGQAQ